MRLFIYLFIVFFVFSLPSSGIGQVEEWPDQIVQEGDSLYYEDGMEEEEEEYYVRKHFLNLDFYTSTPISLTRDHFRKTIFGLQGAYFKQINKAYPIFLGMGFSFGQYSSASLQYFDFVEYDEFLFEKTTSFYLMNFEPRVRYFPGWRYWRLEAFFEFGMDIRHSLGSSSIRNVDLDEGSSMPQLVKGDWSIGYAMVAGALVDIGGTEEGAFGIIKIGAATGPNTFFYIKKDESEITGYEEPLDRFNRRSIPFRFLTISMGITGYF